MVDDIHEWLTQPLSDALNVLEIMVQQGEQMGPLLGRGKHSESRRKRGGKRGQRKRQREKERKRMERKRMERKRMERGRRERKEMES